MNDALTLALIGSVTSLVVAGIGFFAAVRAAKVAAHSQIFRAHQAALSYPEKVRQVVAMQRRLVPIYAARGEKSVPWKI